MRYYLETEKIGLKKLEQLEVTQEYVDWLNDEAVTQTLVSGKLPTGGERRIRKAVSLGTEGKSGMRTC